MRRRTGALAVAALLAAGMPGCKKDPCDVVIYTYVEQSHSEPVIRAFEKESGLRVCASYSGFEIKASGILHRLASEADRPSADVLWADDPVRPLLLVRRGLIELYLSPAAEGIPSAFRAPDGLWTGVGAQARVLLVNTKLVADKARPSSIRDLANPRWKGRVAIPNPVHGSTLVQMGALTALWGEDETRSFLGTLRANEVRVATTSWDVMQLVSKGDVAVGLTNTDHADAAVASGAPVAIVYPDQDPKGIGTLVLPTSVLLLRNGPHPAAGRRLVDYLVSPAAEAALCRTNAYFPLRANPAPPAGMRRLDEIRAMPLDVARAGDEIDRIKPELERWRGR
ncbi:MAG: extracellular solute-binding protein [Deltaproteobacteria bacterium]|nr:extracellular solute-binding protein [Deltaproteobacteria bacterium]